jgi:hypothetical protein
VGCLRRERISNRVIQKITHLDPNRARAAS